MASVVAGGLFNALAFAGAGFLFHKLDKSGYAAEVERHNRAMETFNEEREKWQERQVEHKNKIAALRQELADANKDLDATNTALHNLRVAEENSQEDRQPTLDSYYEPSDEMKNLMNVVTGVMGLGLGYGGTKLLSWFS